MAALPTFPRVVDDVTVRLVAGEVLVISLAACLLRSPWLFAVLAVDFVLRAVFGPRLSPLALFAGRALRPLVNADPRPTAGPPKRFAAAIGLVVTIAIALLAYGGLTLEAWSLVALLVIFAGLESLLGICVGCRVFGVLIRAGVVPESVCVECADISLRRRTTPAR